MFGTIFGCFNGKVSKKKAKVEAVEVRKAVHRDELSKKEPARKTVKKRVRFSESKPTILGEDSEKEFEKSNEVGEKEGMRVRIKLTKEEAARLLSNCNNNGPILQFKDLARELLFIPVNRVNIVSEGTNDIS